ncbi:hypothetical protein [Cellulomonas sp. IC4_254]|uniref:hypothetical protein n=1 Tax=Cellulomonas sp. IC4_254 TaxID=2714040 RepID=UPI0014234F9B|nr:hypothetical protein [Cellulomonas sp. IC4_254]NHT17853.1 hypothetical protein [Cellulomonas sp. IC4_254]
MTFVWEETTAEDREFIESLHIPNTRGPGSKFVELDSHGAVNRSAGQFLLEVGGGLHTEIPECWVLVDGIDLAFAQSPPVAKLSSPRFTRLVISRVFITASLAARRSPDEVWGAIRAGLTALHSRGRTDFSVQFAGTPDIAVETR